MDTQEQYFTKHLQIPVHSPSGDQFTRVALVHYGAICGKRLLSPLTLKALIRRRSPFAWRTPDSVRVNYDLERTDEQKEPPDSWETVVLDPSPDDFVLLENKIVWDEPVKARKFLLSRLDGAISDLVGKTRTVVEFGSGNGRNLLFLKTKYPEVRFIGLELSPVSVQLAQSLADRFQLDIDYYCCDVCDVVPTAASKTKPDLVFSFHALEMMPRIFSSALLNMGKLSPRHIKLFEPIPDFWAWDGKGVASRLRVLALDRLRRFESVAAKVMSPTQWNFRQAMRLGNATNPLNETCELHFESLTW